MTQEELDALITGGLEDEFSTNNSKSDQDKDHKSQSLDGLKNQESAGYRVSSENSWPPPPPTDDHKMVHQLDDVTKDSEKKATEIFDKLELINDCFSQIEKICDEAREIGIKNVEVFTTLIDKFPKVKSFFDMLDINKKLENNFQNITQNTQKGVDEVIMTMDIMQYQDIHRQKIERVINVMRALSKYMNSLFESRIEDSKRAGSAVHIQGDCTTENIVSNADIEALIESLSKK